jgi:hypothetical protein
MDLRNPLTTPRADARYVPQAFVRVDGWDNAQDRVALGAAATYRAFVVDYVVELPVSHRAEVGRLRIAHDGASATIIDHEFSFDDGTEIAGLTFTAGFTGGIVELVLTKNHVGENPTLHYRSNGIAVA